MKQSKRKVISNDNMPTKLPIYQTLIIFLALSYWHAAVWVWVLCTIFMALEWWEALVNISEEDRVNIQRPLDIEWREQQIKELDARSKDLNYQKEVGEATEGCT
jgi:hypothetical protein